MLHPLGLGVYDRHDEHEYGKSRNLKKKSVFLKTLLVKDYETSEFH